MRTNNEFLLTCSEARLIQWALDRAATALANNPAKQELVFRLERLSAKLNDSKAKLT